MPQNHGEYVFTLRNIYHHSKTLSSRSYFFITPLMFCLIHFTENITPCRKCYIILPDGSWRWDFKTRAHIMSPMFDTKALCLRLRLSCDFSYVLSMWACLMFPILYLKNSYCRATDKLNCQCDFISYMIWGRVNIVFYSQRGNVA